VAWNGSRIKDGLRGAFPRFGPGAQIAILKKELLKTMSRLV